jgi:hypothetical protein
MKVCMCPTCGVLYEAMPASSLVEMSDEQVYARTHCRMCETPSDVFIRRNDEPDLGPNEFGYPAAVVRWL